MKGASLSEQEKLESGDWLVSGRLIHLQGRLACPFWGVMGIWAVLCGTFASDHFAWEGRDLLTLAFVLILTDLAWGSLWELATGTDWFHPLAFGWPPKRPASLTVLPYTQPGSPGGVIFRWLNRWVGWWRECFWPELGSAFLGLIAAVLLTAVLTLLLPGRFRLLNAILVALVGVGIVFRRQGRRWLAGGAWVQTGLGWMAGHSAFAEMDVVSVALALTFAGVIWGSLRTAQRLPGGLWLQNGGQVIGVGLAVALKQPLAAGALGLCLLGQVAVQPVLRLGGHADQVFRRTWPWLMAAMLISAWAIS
ncbi:MAG: hypothetical protein ACUVWZ_01605 [Anaerolineae bacterium]